MNVALIGYGKMGKTIEPLLLERGHQIGLIIDASNKDDLNKEAISQCDVAIEFTQPESALSNYQICFEADVPVVSGTTGWLDKMKTMRNNMEALNGALFYAPNFSIGVNIFFKVNEVLAKLLNKYENYDVEMEEIHHKQKVDSPSGTGIRTAEIILQELKRKETWVENVKSSEKELLIRVKREDNVPGTHSVHYLSTVDEISLKHTAFSREGFALGAVLAAEWMQNKKGFFEMKDLLDL